VTEEGGEFLALAGRVEEADAEQVVAAAMGFEGGVEKEGAEFEVPGFGAGAGGPAVLLEVIEKALPGLGVAGDEGEFAEVPDIVAVDVAGRRGGAQHRGWSAFAPAVPGTEAGGEPFGEAEEGLRGWSVEARGEGAAGEDVGGDGLVGGGAEGAVVDEVVLSRGDGTAGVDAALPADAADGEAIGMGVAEEGFGVAVAILLFEVAGEGGAAAVPDEGGGGEGELPVGIEEAPAEIDIVAGGAELFAEAADALEGGAADGEVAAGEVFGAGVVEEDVGGGAGGGGHHGFLEAAGFGGDVWAPGSPDGGVGEGAGQPEEPVAVGFAIVVGVGDEVAGGLLGAAVAGHGKAEVFLLDEADIREAMDDVGGGVGGAVVDDEDFEVGVVDGEAGGEAGLEQFGAVVAADDHGEFWRILEGEGVAVGVNGVLEFAEGGEGGLGAPVAAGEAEAPVVDGAAVVLPAVGPGKEGGAGDARFEAFGELGGEEVGLFLLGVAFGIEAELGDEDGAVAGDVLEALEVAVEGDGVFEVDVEGGEVGVAGFEVFGAGVVGVGVEEVGGDGAAGADEVFDGLADAARAHPADQFGGDLVGDEDGPEGGVVLVGFEELGVGELGPGEVGSIAEEVAGPGPGDGGEDAESVIGGGVEEVAVGGFVNADGVEAGGGDAGELGLGIEGVVRVERSVGDGLQEDTLCSAAEKPAVETELQGSGHGGEWPREGGVGKGRGRGMGGLERGGWTPPGKGAGLTAAVVNSLRDLGDSPAGSCGGLGWFWGICVFDGRTPCGRLDRFWSISL